MTPFGYLELRSDAFSDVTSEEPAVVDADAGHADYAIRRLRKP